MSDVIIKAENISKKYRLGVLNSGSLKQDLNMYWNKLTRPQDTNKAPATAKNELWALKDINFSVARGEVLGFVGSNGAGKSTLLKILSRVTAPTTGTVKGIGRIASMLDVGTGFHPELTGRENTFLNGHILGMTKSEIVSKFDEIIAFSGVEKFIDTPVKRYSSGMYVRLAFAVASHLDPDILIVDEALAVGDAEFRAKCIKKMKSISVDNGKSVMFVSHNMQAMRDLCKRIIYIDHGRIMDDGNPEKVITNYLNAEKTNNLAKQYDDPEQAPGNEFIKMKKLAATPLNENRMPDVASPLHVAFEFWKYSSFVGSLNVGIFIFDNTGSCIVEIQSDAISFEAGVISCETTIPADFLKFGSYYITLDFINNNKRLWTFEYCLSFDMQDTEGLLSLNRFRGFVKPGFPVHLKLLGQ